MSQYCVSGRLEYEWCQLNSKAVCAPLHLTKHASVVHEDFRHLNPDLGNGYQLAELLRLLLVLEWRGDAWLPLTSLHGH